MSNHRIEKLRQIYNESRLSSIFQIRKEDVFNDHSSLRFLKNDFRIRAIEFWELKDRNYFRIYHGSKIITEIKAEIDSIEGLFRTRDRWSDFNGDFTTICRKFCSILNSDTTKELAKLNPILTKNSVYEGLSLPDVDTSDNDVMGRTFDWKDIIAINEEDSEANELKKILSQNGVYLQRSLDGKSRYVGSAYNKGGILARWLKHLNRNGHAKHLNLFVLENGYNNIVFTVLDFAEKDKVMELESRWKSILGTKNEGIYDSYRLNSN